MRIRYGYGADPAPVRELFFDSYRKFAYEKFNCNGWGVSTCTFLVISSKIGSISTTTHKLREWHHTVKRVYKLKELSNKDIFQKYGALR